MPPGDVEPMYIVFARRCSPKQPRNNTKFKSLKTLNVCASRSLRKHSNNIKFLVRSPGFRRHLCAPIGQPFANSRRTTEQRSMQEISSAWSMQRFKVGSLGFCRHLCAPIGQSLPNSRRMAEQQFMQEMSSTWSMQRFMVGSLGGRRDV